MNIQTGDVLLFRGNGFVSKAIRFLDGGEVNHAAIALDATTLAEATGHGLDTAPIAVGVGNNETTWVFRPTGGDPAAAARRAAEYEASGVFYAYQQIMLLAALCLTRRIPISNRIFRKVVRRVLESAADLLNSLIDKGADLMICSEYVYRCYRETGFDLLPGGTPDLAGVGMPGDDTEILLAWLEQRPAPTVPMSLPTGPLEDPAAIAERSTFELEGLLAAFFAEQDPTTPAPMAASAPAEEVTDDQITLAALRFGHAAARLQQARDPQAPAPMGLGLGDLVQFLKGTLSTNANFVTPRDLFHTSTLAQIGTVP